LRERGQVIHHHSGRAKNLFTPAVPALEDLEDRAIRSPRIVTLRYSFMPTRVEDLADALFGLDAMLGEQVEQLSQGHRDALTELRGTAGGVRRQGAFEVVEGRQQLDDE